MSDDFLIDDAGTHLAVSKNANYQHRVRLRFNTVIRFLQENDLTTEIALGADDEVTNSTQIMRSHLNDEGFEVVKMCYDKWLKGLDRGKEISDVSVFEKAVAKIRRR